MSTSELRRGPGWWMDLDGQWNPPEEWPESSPPLPGWIRGADGHWMSPDDAEAAVIADETEFDMPRTRPTPESPMVTIPSIEEFMAPESEAASLSSLRFSDTEAVVQPEVDERRIRNRAVASLGIAMITAIMISAGLIVLLAML